ncbi:MAG TPA: hypothetical protein VKG45_11455 [Actinomycetes bacterium]|nr:hypothetical protein [Actinomycetes bacterium]
MLWPGTYHELARLHEDDLRREARQHRLVTEARGVHPRQHGVWRRLMANMIGPSSS